MTAAVLLSIPTAAHSEVEAKNIILACNAGGNPTLTYQTPSGKVLVVHHLLRLNPDTEVRCTVDGLGLLTYPLCAGPEVRTAFSPPYLIVGDGVGGQLSLVNGVDDRAVVSGLLADQSDMYAAIPSQFTGLAHADNAMDLLIQLASPRPNILRIEEASDLSSWFPADASVFNRGSGEHDALLAADVPTQMFRSRARARK
jgi:hypothetical protein